MYENLKAELANGRKDDKGRRKEAEQNIVRVKGGN